MEFIITHTIKAHPMALVNYNKISNKEVKEALDELTKNYTDKKEYFIDQLSQGIAMIAGAFYPKEVILRTSDFKTNEYAKLLGGLDFEPLEENPMLGFRGASRYYDKLYQEGFKLECAAIKKLREEMGLTNVKVMIPFCRTLTEAKKVIDEMAKNGLTRGEKGFEIFMMVEIPSNVLLLDEFAELFDGFSIGSNDLTQLTLGLDRDSEYVSHIFDENNSAARKMVSMAIKKAKKCKKVIGFCGQAPSDFPEYSSFLIKEGITSISFNPDALINGIQLMNKSESEKDLRYSN
jgi:pyruvate,water dikinase